MARIIDLPMELLTPICHHIRDTSPATLPALLLTCKKLHQAAVGIVYEHICLDWKLNHIASMPKFMRYHQGNQYIRSLRVRLGKGPLNAFKIGMINAYNHVDTLCSFLPTLSKLNTFSINLDGEVDRHCLLPPAVIARILDSLPQSVVNLELDTEGADGMHETRPEPSSPDHLCNAISYLIPRLERFSLRVSCLCTDIFRALDLNSPNRQSSRLRTALIRLDLHPVRMTGPGIITGCRAPLIMHKYGPLRTSKLFDYPLHLHRAGAFPVLERFLFLSWLDEQARDIRVRDIVTQTMTQYPFQHAPCVSEWESSVNPYYMIRNDEGKDFFGEYPDVVQAIMHEVSWKEVPHSQSRIPAPGKVNPEGVRMDTSGLLSQARLLARKGLHESVDSFEYDARVFVRQIE